MRSRAVWAGAFFWVVVCCACIGWRGVGWDESYEWAQVLLGQVTYPEGHTSNRYAWGAFTIQYYVSAGFLWLFRDPVLLCAFRALLSGLASVLPAYALGTVLGRHWAWGHLAAFLVLARTHEFTASWYGVVAWAQRSTSGTIGTGFVLLVVAALLARHWRAAFFLLGLIPLVHVGQLPVPLLIAGCCAVWIWRVEEPRVLRAALGWGAAGVACSAVFWLVQQGVAVPPPAPGNPYYSPEPVMTAWARYTLVHDVHRSLYLPPPSGPMGNSNIAYLGLLVYAAALARLEWRDRSVARPFSWVLLYGLVSACIVWGVLLVKQFAGMQMPFLLVGWQPLRLTTHVAPLVLAVLVALLACWDRQGGRKRLAARGMAAFALAWFLLRPALAWAAPETVYQRYLAPPEFVLFLLGGAGLAILTVELRTVPRFRMGWLALTAAGFAGLAAFHQWGALCVAAGFAGMIAMPVLTRATWAGRFTPGLAALLVLGGLAIFPVIQALGPVFDPVAAKPFEREVAAYFAAQDRRDELLLTVPWAWGYQARTGQPVLKNFEAGLLASYMPSLAPTVQKVSQDVYCIEEGGPWLEAVRCWEARTLEGWRDLAARYPKMRYVIFGNNHPLDLPVILRGESHTLYAIPQNVQGAPHDR